MLKFFTEFFEYIGIDPISNLSLDLSNCLVTYSVITKKNIIIYHRHVGSSIFIPTRSTNSFCTSFLYRMQSQICKIRADVLDCNDSLYNFVGVSTVGLFNSYEMASLITSYSTYLVKSIGFPVFGPSFVTM